MAIFVENIAAIRSKIICRDPIMNELTVNHNDKPMRKEKKVAIFHHKIHNSNMDVVEKDAVVSGMLKDELKRCEEAYIGIHKAISALPKGSLSIRGKLYKNRKYEYHYLKYREGQRVVNQHIAADKLEELKKKLALRKQYEQELKAYDERIVYLKRLLKTKGRALGVQKDR